MNADLNNALLEVQAYFLEAKIYQNVVEFTVPELTTQDILNLSHINRRNPELQPWVFRSDKQVRVVFFVNANEITVKSFSKETECQSNDGVSPESILMSQYNEKTDEGFIVLNKNVSPEKNTFLPDNVNSREEWIEYILTIHQIGVPEIISMNSKTKVSDELSAYFGNKPFIDFITNNCTLRNGEWTYNGEIYTSQGLFDVFINGGSISGITKHKSTDLTFEIEQIIESEVLESETGKLLPGSQVRKVAERISDYVKHGHPNKS